jgi:aarF domain-containing kinase
LEAANQERYRKLVMNDALLSAHTAVPEVIQELTTKQVLTSRFAPGLAIDTAASLPLPIRNAIARTTLVSSIKEVFEWRFVQSDPNFANFLYDHPSRTINFIDFGACREYSQQFVDNYIKLVWAAANKDEITLMKLSKDMGFLTGNESKEMNEAHLQAGFVIGEPFLSHEPFDFGNSSITTRLSSVGSVFMKHRLTPPPSETYSLHRKLAGAFYLCIRLKAVIPCRDILEEAYREYKFD